MKERDRMKRKVINKIEDLMKGILKNGIMKGEKRHEMVRHAILCFG